MKKVIIATALLAMTGLGATAQTVFDNPNNKSYVGIRASLDIPCPGDIKYEGIGISSFKNGAGIDLGFIANFPVVANFYIEPGLNFYYNACGLQDNAYNDIDLSLLDHASMREWGMRIPVSLGSHFDFTHDVSVAVFTGPELEVGFANDIYLTTKKISGVEEHLAYSNYSQGLRRVNCSWTFGVGCNVLRNYYIGVTGAVGMVDLDKSDASWKKDRVSITLGYNF